MSTQKKTEQQEQAKRPQWEGLLDCHLYLPCLEFGKTYYMEHEGRIYEAQLRSIEWNLSEAAEVYRIRTRNPQVEAPSVAGPWRVSLDLAGRQEVKISVTDMPAPLLAETEEGCRNRDFLEISGGDRHTDLTLGEILGGMEDGGPHMVEERGTGMPDYISAWEIRGERAVQVWPALMYASVVLEEGGAFRYSLFSGALGDRPVYPLRSLAEADIKPLKIVRFGDAPEEVEMEARKSPVVIPAEMYSRIMQGIETALMMKEIISDKANTLAKKARVRAGSMTDAERCLENTLCKMRDRLEGCAGRRPMEKEPGHLLALPEEEEGGKA